MPDSASIPVAGIVVHRLPALADNYLWLLQSGQRAVMVDPGDALVVERALERLDLELVGILLTHHHADHIGGVSQLVQHHRCPVHGPKDTRIPELSHPAQEGSAIHIDGFPDVTVWELPGHTRSHLAFRILGAVFVGDVLFGAGCGRNFEGSIESLHHSLQRIAELPDETLVFCAHEYTRANLAFAIRVEPGNPAIAKRLQELSTNAPSVPFLLGEERASNVFLRCEQPLIRRAAEQRSGHALPNAVEVFAALRHWKNEHA